MNSWLCVLIIGLTFCVNGGVAKKARTIRLNDKRTEAVYVTPGKSTILNFPTRPTKVILGNKGLFAVEWVESDLAVSALTPGASSNLFIYLDGRRFGLNLRSLSTGGDEIVLVRDSVEDELKLKVTIKNE